MGLLLQLIDKVHDLLGDSAVSRADIRGHVQSLREHAEALELRAGELETHSQSDASDSRAKRLERLLDEAWTEIERLQFELHQQRHHDPEDEPPKERPPVVNLTQAQMMQSIEAVSPFQQPGVTKSFIGKRVSWAATLDSMSDALEGTPKVLYPIYVCFQLVEGKYDEHDHLFCWASRRDVDALASVERGGLVRVTGTIRDVSRLGSTLEDCTFETNPNNDA